ncbi:hypothetical protein AK812_SmicGene20424 [Symbiodinium microadriaticum]|uniref:Uncharacterized protein n=1 Tax=Symbiodinium microadriaticum TaxID=2951 RepID=A0A1Q9DPY6_SYMMI|nr:hypothetical protein AK812_SmicGene20424 [Symbiodinium microadriaticum]
MSEGQGYALPPAVLDLDEEVFYLRVERSVCKGRKHDRKIIVEVEQQLNKRQFGRHLPAKQAKKAMMDLGILAEHMPSDRALDGVRHRHLEQGKSYDGKSVSTFGAFCQSPPLPVVVLKAEETPLDRCVLVMDATFQTNVQDLVLASLGLVILHQILQLEMMESPPTQPKPPWRPVTLLSRANSEGRLRPGSSASLHSASAGALLSMSRDHEVLRGPGLPRGTLQRRGLGQPRSACRSSKKTSLLAAPQPVKQASDAMFAAGLASIVGLAAYAYSYNLSRFKFDAKLRQESRYHYQDMKIELWKLFREDVRDVFELTRANMDNYMVVGVLIIASVMNFMAVGQSAVRPPVASLVEVSHGMVQQEDYEAGGPSRYGQLPNFQGDPVLPSRDRVTMETPGVVRSHSVPVISHESPRGRDADGLKWLEESAHASVDIVEQLQTEDSGPGSSAALYSHFWMLRKVQRGYACFDAYARISLAVSAQQLLLVEAYYSLGHFMSKSDGWPSPVQNTEGAWLALLSGVYACWILFRLDLYLKKKQRLLVQIGLWLAPLTAAFATQLFNIRTKHGEGGVRPCDQVVPCWVPWLGAILACLCHFFWILIILYVSTPVLATAELPVAFRSAIYLDVFGWHSKYFKPSLVHNAKGDISHWEASDMMQSPVPAAELEQDDQRRVFVAFKEGKRLLRGLTKLTDPEVCKHFRDEDKRLARELHEILQELLKELETQLSMPHLATSGGTDDGSGHLLPYWIDCTSGMIAWSRPDGHILDLVRLGQSVEELQDKVSSTADKTDHLIASEALPFELMPVYPDTDDSSSGLPWKCLQRSCQAQMVIWIMSLLVVLFDPVYYDTPIAPRELYDPHALMKMKTAWPHKRFRPSAIACAGDDTIYIGDQFAVYASDLYWTGEKIEVHSADTHTRSARMRHALHDRLVASAGGTEILQLQNLTVESAIPSLELESSWSSLAIIRQKGKILFLTTDGQLVLEKSLYPWIPGQRTWRLGPTLPHKRLLAIAVVEGRHAGVCGRRHSGFTNMGWAVIAATDSGQVIVLCPTQQGELHPVEMLLSLRRRSVAGTVVEIIDSHTGSKSPRRQRIIGIVADYDLDVLWILSQTSDGEGAVLVFDLQTRAQKGHETATLQLLWGKLRSAYHRLRMAQAEMLLRNWLAIVMAMPRAQGPFQPAMMGLLAKSTATLMEVYELVPEDIAHQWPLPSGRWWVPGLCDLGPGQGMLLGAAADTKTHAGAEIWRFLPVLGRRARRRYVKATAEHRQLLME